MVFVLKFAKMCFTSFLAEHLEIISSSMKQRTQRIMFVCLGNICRSPAAEAVFRHIVENHRAQDRYLVDSSGTASYHVGSLADRRMREAALSRGISIQHKGQQLKLHHLKEFDWILCMDKENLRDARSLSSDPLLQSKIKLFRDFDPEGSGDVPDPYYGKEDGFEKVLDIVTRCGEAFYKYLEKQP